MKGNDTFVLGNSRATYSSKYLNKLFQEQIKYNIFQKLHLHCKVPAACHSYYKREKLMGYRLGLGIIMARIIWRKISLLE